MNERIRLLAEQAFDKANNGTISDIKIPKEFIEKFAELIVRECSLVIRHGGQRKGAFGNEDLRPYEIATMIEEHFGVKE